MKQLIMLFILIFNLSFTDTDLVEDNDNQKAIEEIENNLIYNCSTDERKIIKINGKNFIGSINLEGKFYGEQFLKFKDISYCFMYNIQKFYSYSKEIFYLKHMKLKYQIFQRGNSFQYINSKGTVYFFEKKNKSYIRRGNHIILQGDYSLRNLILKIDEKDIN